MIYIAAAELIFEVVVVCIGRVALVLINSLVVGQRGVGGGDGCYDGVVVVVLVLIAKAAVAVGVEIGRNGFTRFGRGMFDLARLGRLCFTRRWSYRCGRGRVERLVG